MGFDFLLRNTHAAAEAGTQPCGQQRGVLATNRIERCCNATMRSPTKQKKGWACGPGCARGWRGAPTPKRSRIKNSDSATNDEPVAVIRHYLSVWHCSAQGEREPDHAWGDARALFEGR
ncbi:hypothetical protein ACFQS6_09870 [Xanthomonas populi]